MVTIADVARAAGVSAATVSRVMNGSSLVADATAQAVRAAVRQLSYVPNQQARNLRRNESSMVLVLLPNITNQYYASVFSGINETAQKLGYSLFLCNTGGGDPEALLRSVVQRRQADGAILLQMDREERWVQTYSDAFPIVQCCEYAQDCDTPHVSVDNYHGGYQATEYLIKLGHRKIGTISARNNVVSTYQRMLGFQDAMKDAGLAVDPRHIVYADRDYSYPSSLAVAREVLCQYDRPDALFCISDAIALAAVVTAKELHIAVPEDLSIVGFDDVLYTQMIHPYLTTIIQPCAALGGRAMEMLHQLIAGGELEDRSVILPHGFIARESTCAPRRRA